ncbi:DUF393 domain-containing protein [Nakamurella silvestris]|nr:DUF393 domain-containing protein [Nakamurella silvestris]
MAADQILVYDGDCGFCQRAVDTGENLLPDFPKAVPFQWLDLAELGLTSGQTEQAIFLVHGTRQRRGAAAVAAILLQQRTYGWRFLGALLSVPPFSWLAPGLYRLIALNRHRLPGSTDACRLPPRA